MFEKLISELKELERMKQISVPIEADKDGYYDKECPNQDCLFQFKVQEDDWDNIVKEQVYCPMCGHNAKRGSWFTSQQIETARDQAIRHFHGRIGKALEAGARDFNSRQSGNSFISMSVTVSGTRPYHYILPVPAQEEMLLKVTCKICNNRYAVIGSAFFCPACGHNSAEETFDNSLKKIDAKLKNIPVIRKAVEAISKDEAEITCRSLVETSLNECVVAFQRFCEVTYAQLKPSEKVKFNAFQNLDVGGSYWKSLYEETYTDWLSSAEYNELNQLFQKRHLLSHTEGFVDQKYIDKSGDVSYTVGQRIIVKESDVRKLKELIEKIVDILREKKGST